MESKGDQAFHRRRMQNRMAQRRFRRKQRQQSVAEGAQNNSYPSPDLYHQELPSSKTLSPELLDLPDTTADSAWIFSGLDLYDDNALLDGSGFIEMDNPSMEEPDSGHSSVAQAPPDSVKAIEHVLNSTPLSSSSDWSESIITDPSEGASICPPIIIDSPNSANSSWRKGNDSWLSTLHIAAQKGHKCIVRVLLEHKIDCNERDSDGLTPLIYAAIGGYDEVASLLLAHGAHIGDVDGQCRSALHWAVLHRHVALMKVLLNCCVGERSFIDAYDNTGRTALHTAVDIAFEVGVHILLQFGASPHCRARKSVQH